jgi:nucleoside-diphosphate-sugar epimerase
MKILFIGGSGNISSACTAESLRLGHTLIHFNRGNRSEYTFSKEIMTIQGDINKASDRIKILDHAPFDVVVNFICFSPEQIRQDIDFFSGKTRQYIFISSATVYKKPPDHYIVTEECPLENLYWPYAQNKILCELILSSQSVLPYTIVRPSYTFGKTWIPVALTAHEYNPVYRIKKGLPVIVHGDGESLWITTHHTDFARAFVCLYGNQEAINNHFHITSDEVHTWNHIYEIIGKVAGRKPILLHIPSDFIYKIDREWGEGLLGDKAISVVFDNSKIKSVAKNWKALKTFEEGIRESINWYESKPERMIPDPGIEERTNQLISKYVTY